MSSAAGGRTDTTVRSPDMQQRRQTTDVLGHHHTSHNTTSSSTSTALLNYSPVPIPNEDRSTRHQQAEMFRDDADDVPISKVDATLENLWGSISEDEIRKSLLVEAKRRKCWNSRKIEKMLFEEVVQCCCYHYVLESFTETRSTAEAIESAASTSSLIRSRTNENLGQSIYAASSATSAALDLGFSSINATAGMFHSADFGPWDFDVQPDDEFVNQIKILEMPNSHRMGSCHSCKGDALIHCFHCRGFGTDKCTYCRGTGMKAGIAHPALYTHPMIGTFPGNEHHLPMAGCNHPGGGGGASSRGSYPFSGTAMIRPALLGAQRDKPYAAGTPVHFMAKAGLPPPGIGQHDLCIFCHGRGIRDCQQCKGQGKKHCLTCGGNGQVRVFTKLKVAFAVECTDFYTCCEVPELLLRQAKGELIFSETRPYVHPIRKHQINEINEISKRFCTAHLKKLLDSCRVLKQRHCIERIEVAKVRFRLGSKAGCFFVFGNQRLCYIPKSSVSSNCSVM